MTLPNACPKPIRVSPEEKRSRQLARQREKQQERKPLVRTTKVKPRNAKRQRTEFVRCYLSRERVAFVKSLPCFATGIRGKSDNAHVTRDGSEGMGRKGGYRCIAPLTREAHRLWDTNPARFTERFGEFDGDAMAAWTETQWLIHVAGRECLR